MRHRNGPFRRPIRSLGLVLVALASLGLACAHGGHRGKHGFTSEVSKIQVVSTLVGGKNVFIPSTIVVTSGQPVTLSIYNTTEIPHGFRIPALDIAHVLPAQEEYEIELPAMERYQVLGIQCHLHTAHRTATLVVLPARKE
ncbi:MAG: cupredoxin domain-containing protein [Myxococcota bacterium]